MYETEKSEADATPNHRRPLAAQLVCAFCRWKTVLGALAHLAVCLSSRVTRSRHRCHAPPSVSIARPTHTLFFPPILPSIHAAPARPCPVLFFPSPLPLPVTHVFPLTALPHLTTKMLRRPQLSLLLSLLPLLATSLDLPHTSHIPHGLLYLPHASLNREAHTFRLPSPHPFHPSSPVYPVHPSSPHTSLSPSTRYAAASTLLRKMSIHVPGDALTTPHLTRQSSSSRRRPTLIEGARSSFLITYSSSTPAIAKAPFEDGVRLWASLFPCRVRIRVHFQWDKLDEGTLAAASTPFFVPGSIASADKLDDGTIYGPVMAASLQGKDYVDPGDFHIVMMYNAAANWHFGTENAPFYKWDYRTTSLHELTHGIFLSGVVDVDTESRQAFFASSSGSPARFDMFISASTGAGLAEICNQNRTRFYDAVTNSGLAFSTPDGDSFGLFSPTIYLPGSSTYHHDPDRLDSDCRAAGIRAEDCSSLMTEKLPNGYTERSLGEPVLRMMNAVRGRSAGIAGGGATCDVPRGVKGAGVRAEIGERFDVPVWVIATVAAVVGVGGIIAVVGLVSTIVAKSARPQGAR